MCCLECEYKVHLYRISYQSGVISWMLERSAPIFFGCLIFLVKWHYTTQLSELQSFSRCTGVCMMWEALDSPHTRFVPSGAIQLPRLWMKWISTGKQLGVWTCELWHSGSSEATWISVFFVRGRSGLRLRSAGMTLSAAVVLKWYYYCLGMFGSGGWSPEFSTMIDWLYVILWYNWIICNLPFFLCSCTTSFPLGALCFWPGLLRAGLPARYGRALPHCKQFVVQTFKWKKVLTFSCTMHSCNPYAIKM